MALALLLNPYYTPIFRIVTESDWLVGRVVRDTVDAVDAGRRTAHALGAPFVLVRGAGHLSMLGRPRAVAAAVERLTG